MKKPKTFLIDYPFNGGTYMVEFYADSWEDAELRLQSLQNYGKIEGELMAKIPARVPGSKLWARLLCWWKSQQESLVTRGK